MLPKEDEFFTSLYQQYFNQVKLYVLCFVPDPYRAEEIAQDTFHTAMVKIGDVMDAEMPVKWLKRTAKHKAQNEWKIHQRDLKRYLSLSAPETPEPVSPFDVESAVAERLDRRGASVEDVIRQTLTPIECTILKRYVIDHARYAQVADELGISLWDCQKRMQRIRKKLSEKYPRYKKKK